MGKSLKRALVVLLLLAMVVPPGMMAAVEGAGGILTVQGGLAGLV